MKLRILRQSPETHGGEEQLMKTEALELERMEGGPVQDESRKVDSPLLDAIPISAFDPMLVSVSFLWFGV